MKTAFEVIVILALLPQIIFSALYWKWIPHWFRNPYGRLAQLGSWCHIVLLSLYLILTIYGSHFNPTFAGWLLISAFLPLVVFGVLQLSLLAKAREMAEAEKKEREVVHDN